MASAVPEPPPSLKAIKPYLKVASDIDSSQPVVSYYMRFYALQKALDIDKKSPEARQFIGIVMDILEHVKTQRTEEGIKSEMVGQSLVESYGLMLFKRADEIDRAAQFSPNLVKLFYTASLIFDCLSQFGSASEEIEKIRKYAKWKAAYLTACLKSGETPIAGPPMDDPQYANIAAAYTGAGGETSAAAGGTGGGGGYDEAAVAPPAPSSNFAPQLPQVPKGPPTAGPAAYQPLPPAQPQPSSSGTPSSMSTATLSLDMYARALKHCKFAQNALQYEDSPTAVLYLEKALRLLRTGSDD